MKNNPIEKIPLGLSMALSNNPVAFTRFASMTPKTAGGNNRSHSLDKFKKRNA